MDLDEAQDALARLQSAEPDIPIIPICAELAEHTDDLVSLLKRQLDVLPPPDEAELNRILAKRRRFASEKTDDLDASLDDGDW